MGSKPEEYDEERRVIYPDGQDERSDSVHPADMVNMRREDGTDVGLRLGDRKDHPIGRRTYRWRT